MAEMTLFKSKDMVVPDYLRGVDDFTKSIAGGGSGGKSISIEGGVFRMIVDGKEVAKNEERSMNLVFINAAPTTARMFYTTTYTPGVVSAPDCWSADGLNPDASAESPQSKSCATCPQNIKGSGQGDSRACRFSRRFAVLLEGDLEGNVYRLQLSAKSLFGDARGERMPMNAYGKFLAGHGVPISGIVTEARFDTDESVPVLKFRAIRPLTREELATAQGQGASEEAKQAVELRFAKSDKPKVALPAAFDKPAGEPEAEEEAPAPTEVKAPAKRASKKVEPPTPAPKDLDAVMSSWGSDDDDAA